MTDVRIHINEFFVPSTILILFILESEKTSDIYIIIIYNSTKPSRIHNNNFLPTFITDFFFRLIIIYFTIQICYRTNRYNYFFHFGIFFYRKIYNQ